MRGAGGDAIACNIRVLYQPFAIAWAMFPNPMNPMRAVFASMVLLLLSACI